jgi:hypothetical protein
MYDNLVWFISISKLVFPVPEYLNAIKAVPEKRFLYRLNNTHFLKETPLETILAALKNLKRGMM